MAIDTSGAQYLRQILISGWKNTLKGNTYIHNQVGAEIIHRLSPTRI